MTLSPPDQIFAEAPRRCSYLPDQRASLEYRIYRQLTPDTLEELIQRGWRRFGAYVFRPRCARCVSCVPVRIDVKGFRPSKSQRRCLRRNEHVRFELAPAVATDDHIRLYNAWHADMSERRQWPDQETRPELYEDSFLAGPFSGGKEIRYFINDELAGVGLIDLLPHTISSAYFYHAPEWRPLGPGTFSVMCEVELARQLGLDYVYLGYWIAGCGSMEYKNRFHPCQMLYDRPGDNDLPHWIDVDPNAG